MPDDELTRTARQVRAPGRRTTIHALDTTYTSPESGNCYVTTCGRTLTVAGMAVLTTRPVTCLLCLRHDRLELLVYDARKALRQWNSSMAESATGSGAVRCPRTFT